MSRTIRIFLTLIVAVGLFAATRAWLLSGQDDRDAPPIPLKLVADYAPFNKAAELIRPLHETKRPNEPGDWLERFDEGGQSFTQYLAFRSETPLHKDFSAIDVVPLGEFDATQERIIDRTAEFMGHFFGVPVRKQPVEPMPDIPEKSRRMRNEVEQILSTWIMYDILKPRRKPDAIATIGLVTCDLWPGDLNWVFGQASIQERVGVWSLHRNGDPHVDEAAFQLCLRRTLKTAVHETGHMLGIPHCVAYECCMNGSRSREESDRQPLEFCPECQPKIWWSCGADPMKRAKALTEFCEREGLDDEAKQFRKEWDALKK